MRRAKLAMLGAVVALCAVAAFASAQQSVLPTVAVTAGPTAVAVQAPGPIPAGPTRFDLSRQGSKDVSVYLILLNAGVTQQEFEAALRRDDRSGGESAAGLVSIQGSASLAGKERRRALTFTLKPAQTYLVMSENDQDTGSAQQRAIATLTTSGASNGVTRGAPDATIRMVDLRFRGDRVIPRRGIVRVENGDGVPHFAIAFPLRSGVTEKQFGRAVRAPGQGAIVRAVSGAPYSLQNIISGGNTANDNEVRFPKAGRYGLVCFFDGHHMLGMSRVVTVR